MADGRNPRRDRWNHLDHFRKNAAGEYEYAGEKYYFVEQGMTRVRALAVLWALTAGMAAAGAAAGCVPAAGMLDCAYVIVPYAGALVSLISVVWVMCRLTAGGDPLRGYVYRATVGRYRVCGMLVLAFTGAAVLGDVIYLILHGAGGLLPGTVIFLICEMLLLILSFAWKSALSRLKWSK